MGRGQYDEPAVTPPEKRELSSNNVLMANYYLVNSDGSIDNDAPSCMIVGIRVDNRISQSLLVISEKDGSGKLHLSVQGFDSGKPFYPFGDKMFVLGFSAKDPNQYFVQLQRGNYVENLSGEFRDYPVDIGNYEVKSGQSLLCPNNDSGFGATLTGIDGVDSLTIVSGTRENGHTSMIHYVISNGRDSRIFSDDLPFGYTYDLSEAHNIPCMLINLGDTVALFWLGEYPITGLIGELPE